MTKKHYHVNSSSNLETKLNMMPSSESGSAGSSVRRTALLQQQGEKYTLFLLENGTQLVTKIIHSKEDEIVGLGLLDEEGLRIPGAIYAMVTKGSFLELDGGKGNKYKYVVERRTPFDTANATLAPMQPQPKRQKLMMTPSSQMCASDFTADSKNRIAGIGSTPPKRYEHLIPAQVRDHFLCLLDSASVLADVNEIVGQGKLIDPVGGESFDLKAMGETGEEPVQAIPLDQMAADKVFARRVSTEEKHNDGLPKAQRRNLKDLELQGGVATEKSSPDGYFHTNTAGALPGRELPFLVTGIIDTNGSESSPFRGAGEAVANASNAAVAMYKAGVPTERIVIPIVSFTGLLVQFAAVYLLKPCFPVVCFLTAPLRFKEEGQEIAKHLLAMRDSTISMEKYITNKENKLAGPEATETTITNTNKREEWMALDLEQHYMKDMNRFFLARNGERMSFNHFLRVTEPLRDLDCVCLPIAVRLGITKGSGKGPDCIIFEKLNGYKIGMPSRSKDRRQLLAAVKTAVALIHDKGIVHMDLYLSNIMWKKEEDGTFSVKLIDFDAAQKVGEPLTENVLVRLAQKETNLLGMLPAFANPKYDRIYLKLYDQHLDDESLQEGKSGEHEGAVKRRLDARCADLKKEFVEQMMEALKNDANYLKEW